MPFFTIESYRLSALIAEMISFLLGRAVHFLIRRNFTESDTSTVFPIHFQLLAIVDEESTVSDLRQTIERFTTTCKFIRDAAYTPEIITFYRIFHALRWSFRDFIRYRSSSALRPPRFAAINRAFSSFRVSIHLHDSAVSQSLWRSFETWPTTCVASEKTALLMAVNNNHQARSGGNNT